MSGERYWLHTSGGRVPLPGTLKPNVLRPTARSPNLVRARGYREVYDLSDGLPDPAPIVLTGVVEAESEVALSLLLHELRRDLRAATAFSRDERRVTALLGASLVAVPGESDHSGNAVLTVTLIPAEVPDPDDPDQHDW